MTRDQLVALSSFLPEFDCDDKTYTYIAEVTYANEERFTNVYWYVWNDKSARWDLIREKDLPPAVLRDFKE